jgi:predicted metal-dependent hydrolase
MQTVNISNTFNKPAEKSIAMTAVIYDNPSITPRDYHFDMAGQSRWWHSKDPAITAFFNALSLTFPEGERFFIHSVRTVADRVGCGAEPEIRAFVRQEAIHTREHIHFNDRMRQHGYPVDRIEGNIKRNLARAIKWLPPLRQLASTCALEHFTAIFADQLLNDPNFMGGADPEMARMWRWHGLEELEHKAVAYDLYLRATAHEDPEKAYARRARAMRLTTIMFTYRILWATFVLMRHDGIGFSLRAWGRLFSFLRMEDGLLARLKPALKDYFRRDFHPWQHDNRHLIGEWDSRLKPAAA